MEGKSSSPATAGRKDGIELALIWSAAAAVSTLVVFGVVFLIAGF